MGRWGMALVLAAAVASASCRFDVEGLRARDGGAGPQDASPDPLIAVDAAPDRIAARDGTDSGGGPPADAQADAGPPREQCLDGVDNDGDGLVDCLDPSCQADHACVDAPPAGWNGFFHVRQSPGADSSNPLPCPDGSTPKRLGETPVDQPATCSACGCGPKQGASCFAPVLTCWAGKDKCNGSGAYEATADLVKPYCVSRAPTATTTSCRVSVATAVGSDGACTPVGGTATRPAPYALWHDVCAATSMGAGCGEQVCARRPSGGYTALCVRQVGDAACPAGWPVRHLAWAATNDTRGCTACACAAGPASCSGGSYQVFGCTATCDSHCPDLDNPTPLAAGDGCQDLSPHVESTPWSALYTAPTLAPGTCAPSGGAPTGTVERSGAVTYCCRS